MNNVEKHIYERLRKGNHKCGILDTDSAHLEQN